LNSRAEQYQERCERFERAAAVLERQSRLLSNLRGSSFGVFVVAGLVGLFGDGGAPAFGLSGAAFVAFVLFVIRHGRVLAAEELEKRRARVNREALARVTGQWSELDDGAGLLPEDHPYAADLDLVGRRSLFQRISTARTPYGRRALAAMLDQPAPLEILHERQEAARALAPELELR
jgi:hypothetical protein